MHPLFSKVDETMSMTNFAQALDFETHVESAPIDAQVSPIAGSLAVPEWLTPKVTGLTMDGFVYAGAWENDDGVHALFVKPKTPLAKAFWWVGVGAQVQQATPTKQWGVSYSDDEFISVYPDKDLVKRGAEDQARSQGKDTYSIAVFEMPIPSKFIANDSVLEGMQQLADEADEHAEGWLMDVPEQDETEFNKALDMLVDGFVCDLELMPTFGPNYKGNERFPVSKIENQITPA